MKKMVSIIADIDGSYRANRAAFIAYWEDLSRLQTQLEELKARKDDYSESGYKSRVNDLESQIQELRNRINGIPRVFESHVNEIRTMAEKELSGKYIAKPDDVNLQAVTLLNSGVLTDDELREMGEQFANNRAMLRLVAAEMIRKGGKDGNLQLSADGHRYDRKSKSAPHIELIDKFSSTVRKGLSTGLGEYTPEMARGLADHFDRNGYSSAYSEAMSDAAALDND